VSVRGGGAALLLAAALLAGCGDDASDGASPGPATAVTVTFDPDGEAGRPPRTAELTCPPGDGDPGARAACRALREAPAGTFAPVPGDTACTLQYGGPQEGRIAGRVEGREVDARFTRRNGCEIARYDRVEPVLALAR
jgi:hypothetical protein